MPPAGRPRTWPLFRKAATSTTARCSRFHPTQSCWSGTATTTLLSWASSVSALADLSTPSAYLKCRGWCARCATWNFASTSSSANTSVPRHRIVHTDRRQPSSTSLSEMAGVVSEPAASQLTDEPTLVRSRFRARPVKRHLVSDTSSPDTCVPTRERSCLLATCAVRHSDGLRTSPDTDAPTLERNCTAATCAVEHSAGLVTSPDTDSHTLERNRIAAMCAVRHSAGLRTSPHTDAPTLERSRTAATCVVRHSASLTASPYTDAPTRERSRLLVTCAVLRSVNDAPSPDTRSPTTDELMLLMAGDTATAQNTRGSHTRRVFNKFRSLPQLMRCSKINC